VAYNGVSQYGFLSIEPKLYWQLRTKNHYEKMYVNIFKAPWFESVDQLVLEPCQDTRRRKKQKISAATGSKELQTMKLLLIGNLTKITVLTGAMEDKVVDPILDTHHCEEAVVGNRRSPVPASTGACLEAASDKGNDGTRRTRKATDTTKTTQKTDDLINASDDEAATAATIAPVVLHFSEKEDDSEDPTGYDSPSDSDKLEEDKDLLSQDRNKQKDKTGLSAYEELRLANIEKNKNRLREMGLHKKTPPTKKRPPRKFKPKDSEPAKKNPMRMSRTSIDLASDAAGRVDDAIEVPTCMDASRADTSL
jgi:hypothetical protein